VGIKEMISKWGERGFLSQLAHAKGDKKSIACWRSTLNGILCTFNVRSVVPVWPLLTVRSQIEFAANARANGSGVLRTITNTDTVVPNICDDVMNTQTTASDAHNNTVDAYTPVWADAHRDAVQGEDGGRDHSVSVTFRSLTTERSCSLRLKRGQQSRMWSSQPFLYNLQPSDSLRAPRTVNW